MGRIMVGLVLVCTLSCGKDSHTAAPVTRGTTVAAVIKGLDNPFFATMKDGLVATARRHDARLSVDAAAGLQDTAGQASTLESLATQQAGCYVVNPISATNLISPLSHVAKGTPIVNIDSPCKHRDVPRDRQRRRGRHGRRRHGELRRGRRARRSDRRDSR
jgi:ABC-type sugar transport system substrate-binding protein